MHVFIVEDDKQQSELMSLWLENENISCSCFFDGSSLMDALYKKLLDFNLIVLDWNLPDIQGDQLLINIREKIGREIPIIFVSARADKSDVVLALETGADDYMVKPVDSKEWLARIKLQLKRKEKYTIKEKNYLNIGNISIDIDSQNIIVSNHPVSITPKEFAVALSLFKNLGNIVSRDELRKNIWGYSESINTRTVDTHISRIRKKLGLTPENHWRLSSIYNYGYRLELI